MTRRYVYDAVADRVVEVGAVRGTGLSPLGRWNDAEGQYRWQFSCEASDEAGRRIREAALDRADRREFAHKKYGNEHRWVD